MDVGLNLRDLMSSGRLAALSESLGTDRFCALGALAFFYESTQDAELVRASVPEIDAVVRVKLRPCKTEAFVRAMVDAGLADDHGDGTVTIRGNEAHVAKLRAWRANAHKGGKARASQLAAKRQPIGYPNGSEPAGLPSPGDWLLDQDPGSTALTQAPLPFAEAAHLESESRGGSISESAPRVSAAVAKPKRQRTERTEGEQEAARAVRETFLASYARRYLVPCSAWGAPQNAHVYALLKTWPADELVVMARRYFEWARPECIRAGHPFMGGPYSFSAKLHELKADLVQPERRGVAAAVKHVEEQHDFRAQLGAQSSRVFQLLEAEQQHERMGRSGDAGIIGEHKQQDPAGRQDPNAVRDPRPQIVGRSASTLAARVDAVRVGQGDLQSPGLRVQRGANAERVMGERADGDPGPFGGEAVHAAAGDDDGGEDPSR